MPRRRKTQWDSDEPDGYFSFRGNGGGNRGRWNSPAPRGNPRKWRGNRDGGNPGGRGNWRGNPNRGRRNDGNWGGPSNYGGGYPRDWRDSSPCDGGYNGDWRDYSPCGGGRRNSGSWKGNPQRGGGNRGYCNEYIPRGRGNRRGNPNRGRGNGGGGNRGRGNPRNWRGGPPRGRGNPGGWRGNPYRGRGNPGGWRGNSHGGSGPYVYGPPRGAFIDDGCGGADFDSFDEYSDDECASSNSCHCYDDGYSCKCYIDDSEYSDNEYNSECSDEYNSLLSAPRVEVTDVWPCLMLHTTGILEVESEDIDGGSANVFFHKKDFYINEAKVKRNTKPLHMIFDDLEQAPMGCVVRDFPRKRNGDFKMIRGIEVHLIADVVWYGERPSLRPFLQYNSECSDDEYNSECSDDEYNSECSDDEYNSECSDDEYNSECSDDEYNSECSDDEYNSECSDNEYTSEEDRFMNYQDDPRTMGSLLSAPRIEVTDAKPSIIIRNTGLLEVESEDIVGGSAMVVFYKKNFYINGAKVKRNTKPLHMIFGDIGQAPLGCVVREFPRKRKGDFKRILGFKIQLIADVVWYGKKPLLRPSLQASTRDQNTPELDMELLAPTIDPWDARTLVDADD